mmetsp:Transcript_32152/g.75506  ORF Transcript_32152/g.75506 Transcript_32152/m.75506 type:complete len:152 (-) Transcript_32152:38-493(-)
MAWRLFAGAITVFHIISIVQGLGETDLSQALQDQDLDVVQDWTSASVLGLQRGFVLHRKQASPTRNAPQAEGSPAKAAPAVELQKDAVAARTGSILGLQRTFALHRKAAVVKEDGSQVPDAVRPPTQAAERRESATSNTLLMRSSDQGPAH